MPLQIGAQIGPYEIVGALGSGGMGEVYRAHDTKLHRDVAIKVLPAIFATDPERLARFEREARTLASLNHPNIAAIYGIENNAIVMELVPGETLQQTIAARIPLQDVLPIARQMAMALEAAHDHGVIHRDLKPANIKLTADGTVKVLDFGLAKALGPDGGSSSSGAMNSPTLTARATEMGLILGTAAYMAPEQARGKNVDRRADIWSFGVVVTEMLTGERAFKGDDVTEVLARVIEREPDMSKMPAATPPSLRRLLARCLNKDPKQRLRDIGEARILIDEAATELAAPPQSTPTSRTVPLTPVTPSWQRALPWGIAAAAIGVALFAWTRTPDEPAGARGLKRMQVAMPAGIDLYTASGNALSMSPDDSTLAFVGIKTGVRQAFIRRLDSFDATPVRGSVGAVAVGFSNDGRELLIGMSDTSLRRFRLSDGFTSMVAPTSADWAGAWLPDGRISYSAGGRLFVVDAEPGSKPTQLTKPADDPAVGETQPAGIPDADALLFVSARPEAQEGGRIEVVKLSDLSRAVLMERAFAPRITASGHLLFLRDGSVMAARFDSKSLKVIGDPVEVLNGVTVVRNRGVTPILAVSPSGTLIYTSAAAMQSDLVVVARDGNERTLRHLDRSSANPRISADGKRVITEEIGGGLWLLDVERGTEARVTDGAAVAGFPIFGVADREVIHRTPSALVRRPLDGSARAEQIKGTGPNEFPAGITGTDLIFVKLETSGSGNVYRVPIAGGTPAPLLSSPAYEGGAQVSPDGKWMIYVSDELGQSEIFLQPYPALGRRVQVSSAGGIQPAWHPKSNEIFYRAGDDVMSVKLTATPAGPVLAPPTKVFTARYGFGGGLTIPNWSVMPDGDHFLMIKEQSRAIVNVVLNWFEELNAKVK